jgi:hypothetical protein
VYWDEPLDFAGWVMRDILVVQHREARVLGGLQRLRNTHAQP